MTGLPRRARACIVRRMIRPHPPNETPAEPPARSGESGSWSSPWELDDNWQEASRTKKSSRDVFADDLGSPSAEPPKARPVEREREGAAVPPRPSRVQSVPAAHRPHLPPARQSSWGTSVILSMGLLTFVFLAWVYLEDEPPGSDDDLQLKLPVDQAASIRTPDKLKRFLDALVPFENGDLYGQPPWLWDTPTLSRAVQSNGVALDNLRDLLEDPDWHPNHAAWHAEDVCSDARWHQALLLKQVEVAYLSRRQQEEEAFTAAIDLAETGWRLEQILAWPSCYQRSLEAQTRAAQSLADLLRQTRLPETTLRQFQRQFSVCQPTREMLEGAMNAYYVHEKKRILGARSGELLDTMPGGAQLERPGRLFFKPNETVQLFATAFRQLKEEIKAPLAQTSEVRLKLGPAEGSGFQPNSEGQAYFARRMKTYTALPAFLDLMRTRGNLVVTLFAVRRCVAEKKTPPATLEQLRSFNYLLDLPPDPYTGAPLQYNLSRGLIWSVGNDLKSAGGAFTEPPMNDATEPTVETGIAVAGAVK